jgi:cobyrinic acid a,c-diamide synthase
MITRKTVAEKVADYLHHKISLSDLVDWAETAMMQEEFDEKDFDAIRDCLARLGVADVRAFGLAWEDCENLLRGLGCAVRVEVEVA